MFQFMTLAKAMADENRVRILMALSTVDELCVCHINELLGLAPSTVSKHLFLLRNSRLLTARKDGRWIYYRLNNDAAAPPEVVAGLDWIAKAIAEDPLIKADQQRLAQILSGSPQAVCSP
jgi:DNA-binding transcriptional ArsR family regulator